MIAPTASSMRTSIITVVAGDIGLIGKGSDRHTESIPGSHVLKKCKILFSLKCKIA